MYRRITNDFLTWKDDSDRLPVILRGARQVGKSYFVEGFGKEYFQNTVEINFELEPELKECFNNLDPNRILNEIELRKNVVLNTSTLLFLDEIQDCPQAILALRYFKEKKPEIPIIAAGSLLEFALRDADFRMPVGRVQYLYMKPLSFEEYLEAKNLKKLVTYLRGLTIKDELPSSIHQQLLNLLKEYLIVGGMPAVVKEFLLTERFQSCQIRQSSLLATFRDDFGKYARLNQHQYLQIIFDRAPALVGETFKYVKIAPHIRARELKPALENLRMAGLIDLIYRTSASGLPFIATRDEERFKLQFLDVGLTVKATQLTPHLILQDQLFALNRGALMEQFVGQELLAYSTSTEAGQLYYWSREKTGSSAEIDFVLEVDNVIIPIEVKAGSTGRLKSLQVFMQEKQCPLGVKISLNKIELKNNILSVPAYMIHSLPKLVREVLEKNF